MLGRGGYCHDNWGTPPIDYCRLRPQDPCILYRAHLKSGWRLAPVLQGTAMDKEIEATDGFPRSMGDPP